MLYAWRYFMCHPNVTVEDRTPLLHSSSVDLESQRKDSTRKCFILAIARSQRQYALSRVGFSHGRVNEGSIQEKKLNYGGGIWYDS